MNKKIILILICLVTLLSCGKKADPEYQASRSVVKKLIIC